ncbi:penton protein [Barthadenovirus mellis]|uniref:Penton protein n=1 Tax=Passerine adenovirus 1 TaxID=2779174 RepID=A0A7L9DIW6_9ADEN|nr:penton protein [Passerine adenovirus 1]
MNSPELFPVTELEAGFFYRYLESRRVCDSPSSLLRVARSLGVDMSSGGVVDRVFTPPTRVLAPTEGRSSITYAPLPPVQDVTRIFMIDNKTSDIRSLNMTKNHSDFFTNVIQNATIPAEEASTQDIKLDDRSRWVGQLRTALRTCCPNATAFNNSNSLRARLPVGKETDGTYRYEWTDITVPEGDYTLGEMIDMLNNAVVEHFLAHGRQGGLTYADIGVKFDTRLFTLGEDPVTGLITPGVYTYKAFHPDVVLLPGCAIDFTRSRLSNFLGIRKVNPYEVGFVLSYDDLEKGNLPPLMDVDHYVKTREAVPLRQDGEGMTYHVQEDASSGKFRLSYRSWATAYHAGGPVREWTILTSPDITGGLGQLYWSLPDLYQAPVTFAASARQTEDAPVVASQLFPLVQKATYNVSNVYAQLVERTTNRTVVFDRFQKNEIYRQAPYPTVAWINENVPVATDHGYLPLKSSITGVQRVTVTDDRRRVCPYIQKSLAFVDPRVISSATLQ